MTVLEARALTVRLGKRTLLTGVDLVVEAGRAAAVLGPSGSGKSVLIRALCGLQPAAGEVLVGGTSSVREGWSVVQDKLGVLLGLPGLMDDINVFDNVAYRLRRHGVDESEVRTRVEAILGELGLGDAGEKMPAQLSGGMRRRAGLARALVHRPVCLLLDDPTAGLDPITAKSAIGFILDAARRHGTAVLVTTNDVARVAAAADEAWMIRDRGLRRLEGGPEDWTRALEHGGTTHPG
ncbi:MAG: ATP-binding cassette domain-containing protein [Myxococcota bacterium]